MSKDLVVELTTFGQLWDGWEAVMNRLASGRADLKLLKGYLIDRAKIESAYTTSMMAASKFGNSCIDNSGVSQCINDVRTSVVSISTQHSQFGTVCSEIVTDLDKMLTEIKTCKARFVLTYDKLNKEKEKKFIHHNKLQKVYGDAVQKAEASVQALEEAKRTNQAAKVVQRLEKTTAKDVHNSNDAEAEYIKAVGALKEAQECFDQEVCRMQDEAQQLEARRLQMVTDQLTRYTEQQQSIMAIHDKVHAVATGKLQSVNVASELKAFVAAKNSGTAAPPHISFLKIPSPALEQYLAAGSGGSYVSSASSASSPTASERLDSVPDVSEGELALPTLPSDGAMYCRALYDFSSQDAEDLSFTAQSVLRVHTCPDDDEWWSGELVFFVDVNNVYCSADPSTSAKGMFPKIYVEVISQVGQAEPSPIAASESSHGDMFSSTGEPSVEVQPGPVSEALPRGSSTVLPPVEYKVVYNFEGQSDDELTLTAGEIVSVVGVIDEWYLGVNSSGQKGIFPVSFVKQN
mmetsp:Transcript_50685/g.99283  ORF Transcript_50685/g.99283 Transcript_50685/m.99283 type:complete len:518 (+) Transcript_50685:65-1618(+)|eukprot:CAMPEP_0175139348 /NCGR_PEP_ID=MMETSP0087-20121206/10851_1 /TAXON_ID=136419 /ORGANISM="Unknown Unknown, Strain D1" /LENGTH=517 /DNA_ID=CAMNT_0016422345 /DNA_START=64 /DNA_END=1617 /DNA_ORIENTATION=+